MYSGVKKYAYNPEKLRHANARPYVRNVKHKNAMYEEELGYYSRVK